MAIQKIDTGSTNHMIHQLWICPDKEELQKEIESYTARYHPCGYGTRFTQILPCESIPHVKSYAGQFFTNMSRGTSCD